jgi:hypothetical protein
MIRIAWISLLVLFSTGGIQAQTADTSLQVDLDIKALAGPLRDLNPEEEQAVEDTIELIRHGEHTLALLSLARLTGRNPNNSALRVLRAYVLLQLGNLLGALDDARAAESGRIHSAYRCWFLAQVAYLAGNKGLCKREALHLAGDPSYGRKARALTRKLAGRNK